MQDFIQAILDAHFAQLVSQVGDHAAGHLVLEHARIEIHRLAARLVPAVAHVAEIAGHVFQRFTIEPRDVTALHQSIVDPLRRRMRCAVGQRRNRGVQLVRAGFDCRQQHLGRAAGHAMRVNVDGHWPDGLAQRRNDGPDTFHRKHAAGILEIDLVSAHAHELRRLVRVIRIAVHRAPREHQRAHHHHAHAFGRGDADLDVLQIIELVVHRDLRNAVRLQAFDRQLHHIVGEYFESPQTLPAHDGIERRPGNQLAHVADALPRVFLQEAH